MIIVKFPNRILFMDEVIGGIILGSSVWLVVYIIKKLSRKRKKKARKLLNKKLRKLRGGDKITPKIISEVAEATKNYELNDPKLLAKLKELYKCNPNKTTIVVTAGAIIAAYIKMGEINLTIPFVKIVIIISNPLKFGITGGTAFVFLTFLAKLLTPEFNLAILLGVAIHTSIIQGRAVSNLKPLPTLDQGVDYIENVLDNRPRVIMAMPDANPVMRFKIQEIEEEIALKDVVLGPDDTIEKGDVTIINRAKAKILPLKHRTKTLEDLKSELSAKEYDEINSLLEKTNAQKYSLPRLPNE